MARTAPAPKPPEAAAALDPTPDTSAAAPREAAAAPEEPAAGGLSSEPEPSAPEPPAADPPAPAAQAPVAAAPAGPTLVLMPEANGRTDRAATDLLLDACDRWGVHPGVDQRPRELLSWKFYPAQPIEGIPAAVVIVTAGGTKLKHFADARMVDAETDETLRRIFRAYEIDPRTKETRPAPLPLDQTLPETAVTGLVTSTAHQHRGGYLRRART